MMSDSFDNGECRPLDASATAHPDSQLQFRDGQVAMLAQSLGLMDMESLNPENRELIQGMKLMLLADGPDAGLPSFDEGARASQAAEAHLAACDEVMFGEEEGDYGDDPEQWPESPAIGPYCGCETCRLRETLYAVWTVIETAQKLNRAV